MIVDFAIIRDEVFGCFPSIELTRLDIRPASVMENFILPAKVSKSLVAYLVKIEQVETWTFGSTPVTREEQNLVLELKEQVAPLLVKLTQIPQWNQKEELFDHLNWLLARMPMIQCIYAVKFLDQSNPEYLEKLFESKTDEARLLKDRLISVYKAIKLTGIFSYGVFERIINILRNADNGKAKTI